MLSMFDIENLSKSQIESTKMMLMRISNQHNNIDMKFNTKNDKTRITLIGNIEYIDECISELKKLWLKRSYLRPFFIFLKNDKKILTKLLTNRKNSIKI